MESHTLPCQALAIARRYDPQGVRTVGVLTKLDMMDQVILQ